MLAAPAASIPPQPNAQRTRQTVSSRPRQRGANTARDAPSVPLIIPSSLWSRDSRGHRRGGRRLRASWTERKTELLRALSPPLHCSPKRLVPPPPSQYHVRVSTQEQYSLGCTRVQTWLQDFGDAAKVSDEAVEERAHRLLPPARENTPFQTNSPFSTQQSLPL